MRLAALVFGALAGFVASLILALGGLEVTAAAFGGLTERQLVLVRFILIFIANLSLLGAGIALAIPRIGAALTLLSALAWAISAFLLGHSFDLVLLTPPVLALLATALAFASEMFRGGRYDLPPLSRRERKAAREEEWNDSPSQVEAAYLEPVVVAANTRTTQPMRSTVRGLDERQEIPGRLAGVKPKPRPMRPATTYVPGFRQLDEPYEESGFGRFARLTATVMSFALYAAIAGVIALVIYSFYDHSDRSTVVAENTPAAASTSKSTAKAPATGEAEPKRILLQGEQPTAPVAPTPTAQDGNGVMVLPDLDLGDATATASDRLLSSTGLPLSADLQDGGGSAVDADGNPAPVPALRAADKAREAELAATAAPAEVAPVETAPEEAEPAPATEVASGEAPPAPATMSPRIRTARRNGGNLPPDTTQGGASQGDLSDM